MIINSIFILLLTFLFNTNNFNYSISEAIEDEKVHTMEITYSRSIYKNITVNIMLSIDDVNIPDYNTGIQISLTKRF